MKAVFVTEVGGIEKLRYEEIPTPKAGPGQALVKLHSIGVNFIDIYFRTGLYKAEPPVVLGMEASGVVEEVGEGVSTAKVGERVVYCMTRGSYAEYAVVPAGQLLHIPDGLDFDSAAGSLLQGMTAHYLTHSTWPLKIGETCLVQACAGGAGLWTVAAAKVRGARVIGTTSTTEKAARAKAAGCDEVILYTQDDFEVEVKKLTGGKGVDVVYDSVGASTWEKSLNCLRPRGMMVTFGNASGPAPDFSPLVLSQKGSLFLTRPTLAHYTLTRQELEWRAGDVFLWLLSGKAKLHIEKKYALKDAGQAHADLASRKTSGKLMLEP
jgi:NADPH:quinone reductase